MRLARRCDGFAGNAKLHALQIVCPHLKNPFVVIQLLFGLLSLIKTLGETFCPIVCARFVKNLTGFDKILAIS